MSHNRGHWQKGQSGNAKGRPYNGRALATVLREVGEHDSFAELPNKKLMAQAIWQAVSYGEIHLLGGKTYELTMKEWFEVVKWLNSHVDGAYNMRAVEPPPPEPIDEDKFYNDPFFRGAGVQRSVNAKGLTHYDDRSLYLLKQDGFVHRSELETGEPLFTLIETVPSPDDNSDNPNNPDNPNDLT